MILEVRKFPESQEVMEDSEWFFIMDTNPNENRLGQGSYARILDKSEYILVEKTTADEFNNSFKKNSEIIHNHLTNREDISKDDCMITYADPRDENEWVNIWINIHYKGDYINIPYNYIMFLWT